MVGNYAIDNLLLTSITATTKLAREEAASTLSSHLSQLKDDIPRLDSALGLIFSLLFDWLHGDKHHSPNDKLRKGAGSEAVAKVFSLIDESNVRILGSKSIRILLNGLRKELSQQISSETFWYQCFRLLARLFSFPPHLLSANWRNRLEDLGAACIQRLGLALYGESQDSFVESFGSREELNFPETQLIPVLSVLHAILSHPSARDVLNYFPSIDLLSVLVSRLSHSSSPAIILEGYRCINSIMHLIKVESVSRSQRLVSHVMRAMERVWSPRLPLSVQTELASFIHISRTVLESCVSTGYEDELSTSSGMILEQILVCCEEISGRHALRAEHLLVDESPWAQSPIPYLDLEQSSAISNEHYYLSQAGAILIKFSQKASAVALDPNTADSASSSKRQRRESCLDLLMRHLKFSDSLKLENLLPMLVLHLRNSAGHSRNTSEILEFLMSSLGKGQESCLPWILLAFSSLSNASPETVRSVQNIEKTKASASVDLSLPWVAATRRLISHPTCKVSLFFVANSIKCNSVKPSTRLQAIETVPFQTGFELFCHDTIEKVLFVCEAICFLYQKKPSAVETLQKSMLGSWTINEVNLLGESKGMSDAHAQNDVFATATLLSLICSNSKRYVRQFSMHDLLKSSPNRAHQNILHLSCDRYLYLGKLPESLEPQIRTVIETANSFSKERMSLALDTIYTRAKSILSFEEHFNMKERELQVLVRYAIQLGVLGFGLLLSSFNDSEGEVDLLDQLGLWTRRLVISHARHANLETILATELGRLLQLPHDNLFAIASRGARSFSKFFAVDFWQELLNIRRNKNDTFDIRDQGGYSWSAYQFGRDTPVTPVSWGELDDGEIHQGLQGVGRILAASCLNSSQSAPSEASKASQASQFLVLLPPVEFLAMSSEMRPLLSRHAESIKSEVEELLRHMASSLESHELQRSEIAMLECLRMLSDFSPIWSGDQTETVGKQLFEWFLDEALGQGLLSPDVRSQLVQLCLALDERSPNKTALLRTHADSQPRPLDNTRTVLIYGVGKATNYGILELEPAILTLFVQTSYDQHEGIVDEIMLDISSSLSAEFPERIAIVQLVLAKLLIRHPALLFPCTRYLIECALKCSSCSSSAKQCLDWATQALKLRRPRDIWRICLSSLVYQALESAFLGKIPFEIFGFETFEAMLAISKDEIVAQVFMRGRPAEAASISKMYKTEFSQLVLESFSHVAAYSIMRDVAIAPGSDQEAANAVVRAGNILGTEHFASLLVANFAEVLSLLFQMTERENDIQKAFESHPDLQNAASIFHSIHGTQTRSSFPSSSEQPTFRASGLVGAIDYVCEICGTSQNTLWTSALYLYILRSLAFSMQPPLHPVLELRALRRISILIAFAGPLAVELYPVQILLHTLTPNVNSPITGPIAQGLFKYLFRRSKQLLADTITFTLDLCLPLLCDSKTTRAAITRPLQSQANSDTGHNTPSSFSKWLEPKCRELVGNIQNQETKVVASRLLIFLCEKTPSMSQKEGYTAHSFLRDLLHPAVGISHVSRVSILSWVNETRPPFRSGGISESFKSGWDAHASELWQLYVEQTAGTYCARLLANEIGLICTSFPQSEALVAKHSGAYNGNPIDSVDLTQRSIKSSLIDILRALCSDLWKSNGRFASICERTLQVILNQQHFNISDLQREAAQEAYICSALGTDSFRPTALNKEDYPVPSFTDLLAAKELPTDLTAMQSLALALSAPRKSPVILKSLTALVHESHDFASKVIGPMIHTFLLADGLQTEDKINLEKYFDRLMRDTGKATSETQRCLLSSVLYLRAQPMAGEKSTDQRDLWLTLDFDSNSAAATRIGDFRTALMLFEIGKAHYDKSHRPTGRDGFWTATRTKQLDEICRKLPDQDFHNALHTSASLRDVMNLSGNESASFRSLSFMNARSESQLETYGRIESTDIAQLSLGLEAVGFYNISQAVMSLSEVQTTISTDATYRNARRLENWDLVDVESSTSPAAILYEMFRDISRASTGQELNQIVSDSFDRSFVAFKTNPSSEMQEHLRLLASIADSGDLVRSRGSAQLDQTCKSWGSRMLEQQDSLMDVLDLVSDRVKLLNMLPKHKGFENALQIGSKDSRWLQAGSLLGATKMYKSLNDDRKALATVTTLDTCREQFLAAGLHVDAAIDVEVSNVLWNQSEYAASISLLNQTCSRDALDQQDHKVSMAQILSLLGSRAAEARTEHSSQIVQKYLQPALEALRGDANPQTRGIVYHQYASFCDSQLRDTDRSQERLRIKSLRDSKRNEVRELEAMAQAAQAATRDSIRRHLSSAKQWLKLDENEHVKQSNHEAALLRGCLENYLLGLKVCDDHDADVMRFTTLWLSNTESSDANDAVKSHIDGVGSHKLAPLIEQWCARLSDDSSSFQRLLAGLVFRICKHHPYHGMHQLFSSSKARGKDAAAKSRVAAANAIVNLLREDHVSNKAWLAIHNTNVSFTRFAIEGAADKRIKQGAKLQLQDSDNGQTMENNLKAYRIPPLTLEIPLRSTCDYSDIPTISAYSKTYTIASGNSKPKIITLVATDGKRHKELYKGGTDDLRQDAIMEQVFKQVNTMLVSNREARRRKIRVRNYKIVPLTSTAGVIEFVSNTIPLHDYVQPAQARHFPKDLTLNQARKVIEDVQGSSVEKRIDAYRRACQKVHPVLKYFFFEQFLMPDQWYEAKLAYIRSTAAISMVGYVLGVGDRHLNNILLDKQTGEVVHIDLGIAFEQGRVLPVPELVPFRLTRAIVDGMGVTGIEGVFRKSCEFTMETLRKESQMINTILDVLRFDPLHSWSISPLRLRKLQQNQLNEANDNHGMRDSQLANLGNNKNNEADADRALTVVNKKLSSLLSVSATVNELIQQASDERNLALLYCGWSAYV